MSSILVVTFTSNVDHLAKTRKNIMILRLPRSDILCLVHELCNVTEDDLIYAI